MNEQLRQTSEKQVTRRSFNKRLLFGLATVGYVKLVGPEQAASQLHTAISAGIDGWNAYDSKSSTTETPSKPVLKETPVKSIPQEHSIASSIKDAFTIKVSYGDTSSAPVSREQPKPAEIPQHVSNPAVVKDTIKQAREYFCTNFDNKPLAIEGPQTLSVDQIYAELKSKKSPAADAAQDIYDLAEEYGIKASVLLGFFWIESMYGTHPDADISRGAKSIGNIRVRSGEVGYKGFRKFETWGSGARAWFELLRSDVYIGDGLTTVESIVPRYAPNADNNNEENYIATVRYKVDQLECSSAKKDIIAMVTKNKKSRSWNIPFLRS